MVVTLRVYIIIIISSWGLLAIGQDLSSLVDKAQTLRDRIFDASYNKLESDSFSVGRVSTVRANDLLNLKLEIEDFFEKNRSENELELVMADLNAVVFLYMSAAESMMAQEFAEVIYNNGQVQKLPEQIISHFQEKWALKVPFTSYTYVFRDLAMLPKSIKLTPLKGSRIEDTMVLIEHKKEVVLSELLKALTSLDPQVAYLDATKCMLGTFVAAKYLRALEVLGQKDNLKQFDFDSFCLGVDTKELFEAAKTYTKEENNFDERDLLVRSIIQEELPQVAHYFDKSLIKKLGDKVILNPKNGEVGTLSSDAEMLLLAPETFIDLTDADQKYAKFIDPSVLESVNQNIHDKKFGEEKIKRDFLSANQLEKYLVEYDQALQQIEISGGQVFYNYFQSEYILDKLWEDLSLEEFNALSKNISKEEFSKRLKRLEAHFFVKSLGDVVSSYALPLTTFLHGEIDEVKAYMLYDLVSVAKNFALQKSLDLVYDASVNLDAPSLEEYGDGKQGFLQDLKLEKIINIMQVAWPNLQLQIKKDFVSQGNQRVFLGYWISRTKNKFNTNEALFIEDYKTRVIRAAFKVKKIMTPSQLEEMSYDINLLASIFLELYRKNGQTVSKNVFDMVYRLMLADIEKMDGRAVRFFNQKNEIQKLISKTTNLQDKEVLLNLQKHLGLLFAEEPQTLNAKVKVDNSQYLSSLLDVWSEDFSSSEVDEILKSYKQSSNNDLDYDKDALYLTLLQFYNLKGWHPSNRLSGWLDLIMSQQAQAVSGGSDGTYKNQKQKLQEVLAFLEQQSSGLGEWYEILNKYDFSNYEDTSDQGVVSRAWQTLKETFSFRFSDNESELSQLPPVRLGQEMKLAYEQFKELSKASRKDRADYFLLKKFQKHMGYELSQEPGVISGQNLKEIIESKEVESLLSAWAEDFNENEIRALIAYYRIVLKQKEMGAFHLIDLPIKARDGQTYPLYHYLGIRDHNNVNESMERNLQLAVNETIKNVREQIHVISSAKAVEDLSDFIIESQVINKIFGESDKDQKEEKLHITPKNVGEPLQDYRFANNLVFLDYHKKMQAKMRASHLLFDQSVNSMFAAYHSPIMGVAAHAAIEAMISGVTGLFTDNTPQVKDLFQNSSLQPEDHTPIIGMLEVWLLRRYLPNRLGGTFFANVTHRSAKLKSFFPNAQFGAGHMFTRFVDSNRFVTRGYWKLFWGVWGGQLGYQHFVSEPTVERELENLKKLFFTEIDATGTSLITAAQYLKREAETQNYSDMIKDQVKWGAVFLVLPAAGFLASNVKFIGNLFSSVGNRYRWANEVRLSKLSGNPEAEVKELKQLIISRNYRFTKRFWTYFNDLNVPLATWRPDQLLKAYNEVMKSSVTKIEKRRAELAYRKLMLHLYREFTPIVRAKTPITKEMYQLAYFKTQNEAWLQLIINEGERLILTGGRL